MGNVTCDLTRESAIRLIIDDRNSFKFVIFCNTSDDELDRYFEELDLEVENFKQECKNFKVKCFIERNKLNKLAWHEILEIGENKGLWKQGEKQKRLTTK